LNNLLLRKQLLITEAEVHRDQMRQDFQIIDESIDSLGRKARSFGTVLSVVSLVAGGLTAFKGVRNHSKNGAGSAGLFSRLFSGVRLASSLWRGWNSIKHSANDRSH
jgi:hypothetical protein